MKLKHILGIALIVVGGLYVIHMYRQHGGVSSFTQGLGVA